MNHASAVYFGLGSMIHMEGFVKCSQVRRAGLEERGVPNCRGLSAKRSALIFEFPCFNQNVLPYAPSAMLFFRGNPPEKNSPEKKHLKAKLLIADDMRISTVIMDGFEILGADRKPGNIIIFFKFLGNVPYNIFDKLGIGKCGFRDFLFVHTL